MNEVFTMKLTYNQEKQLKTAVLACIPLSPNKDQITFQAVYDPQQTHMIASISKTEIDDVKASLRKLGINKFRKVDLPLKMGQAILCFNAENFKFD